MLDWRFLFCSLRILYFISLRTFTLFFTWYVNLNYFVCEFEVVVEVLSLQLLTSSLHLIGVHFSYFFDMVYNFPTNSDFDSWVLSSKPRTVKQYVD